MNIAQINQHQSSHPSKETRPTEIDPNLLQAFRGQLQFAEADLDLLTNPTEKKGDFREQYEKVEKKRLNEDEEKSVTLSYLNHQSLEDRLQKTLKSKSIGKEMQAAANEVKDQQQQKVVEGAFSQKKLNQEIGNDRIMRQKPHVISSGMDTSNTSQVREEFGELLKSHQHQQKPASIQSQNKATISEFPAESAQVNLMPNQGQQRMDRNLNLDSQKTAKPEVQGINAVKAGGDKASTTAEYRLNKNETSVANNQGKTPAAKGDGFSSQLTSSLKESQKTESSAPATKPQPAETEQQNVKDVVNNVRIMLSSGKDVLTIRLTPEHLGRLEIKLKKAGDVLTGEFRVENKEAKSLLMSQVSKLQEDMKNQGIKLDQIHVYVKGEESSILADKSIQNKQLRGQRIEQRSRQQRTSGMDSDVSQGYVERQQGKESPLNILI